MKTTGLDNYIIVLNNVRIPMWAFTQQEKNKIFFKKRFEHKFQRKSVLKKRLTKNISRKLHQNLSYINHSIFEQYCVDIKDRLFIKDKWLMIIMSTTNFEILIDPFFPNHLNLLILLSHQNNQPWYTYNHNSCNFYKVDFATNQSAKEIYYIDHDLELD